MGSSSRPCFKACEVLETHTLVCLFVCVCVCVIYLFSFLGEFLHSAEFFCI
jgi:hypothetical protein